MPQMDPILAEGPVDVRLATPTNLPSLQNDPWTCRNSFRIRMGRDQGEVEKGPREGGQIHQNLQGRMFA